LDRSEEFLLLNLVYAEHVEELHEHYGLCLERNILGGINRGGAMSEQIQGDQVVFVGKFR
jgi:hypothetical protein